MVVMEIKIGKITVIYNNESNGFAICLFETEDEQFKTLDVPCDKS